MKAEDYINACQYGDSRVVLRQMVRDGLKASCCVTSPPYFGLRSYLDDDDPDKPLEIGAESLDDYIGNLVDVFRQVRAALNDDGVLWVQIGDGFNASGGAGGDYGPGGKREGQPKYKPKVVPGLKPKDMIGVPWRIAFALQSDGWWLRSDIIWHKSKYLPEAVEDRCPRNHEYLFMLSKNRNYYFNGDAIREPHDPGTILRRRYPMNNIGAGCNIHSGSDRVMVDIDERGKRRPTVWSFPTSDKTGGHHATFPSKLAETCILATSKPGDIVLDPFFGSGTVGQVAERLGRRWAGIELNKASAPIIDNRTAQMGLFT